MKDPANVEWLTKPLVLAVVVATVLGSVFGLSYWLPLFDLDEGAFSEATREMLATNNWVATYLNGEPRYDKPILVYWFQAVAVQLFGPIPFSFRLPSMLAAMAWLYVTYRFVQRVMNPGTALLAVWLLATSWLCTLIFKAAISDALLHLWLVLTFFSIYFYFNDSDPKRLPWLGLVMGLGFLTKGPVAVVLPVITSFIAAGLAGRLLLFWQAVLHPKAWGVFLLVILPWHIAVYFDQGLDFFRGFYLGHNLSRFSQTMESHGGSVWYYLLLVPLIAMPFSGQLFGLIRQLWAGWRGLDFLHLYLVIWFLVTLLLFSFSQTQLPHYILYGMTPVYILLAERLLNPVPGKAIQRLQLGVGLIFAALFAWLPLAFGQAAALSDKPFDRAVLELAGQLFMLHYIWLSLVVTLLTLAGFWLFRKNFVQRLLVISFSLMLSVNVILLPLLGAAQQEPVREAAQLALTRNGNLVSFKINMPSFSVYSDQVVPRRQPQPGDLVFTKVGNEALLTEIDPKVDLELIFQRGGITLYQYGANNDSSD